MAMLNNQMVYKMVFISATLPDTNGDGIYNQHISLSNGIVESKGQPVCSLIRWTSCFFEAGVVPEIGPEIRPWLPFR